jgi:hypothetical protein
MDFLVKSEKCGWPLTPNPDSSCERVEMLQEIIHYGNGLHSGRAKHCCLLLRKSALTHRTFAERKETITRSLTFLLQLPDKI